MEESLVQLIEDFFQIVVLTDRPTELFAATGLSQGVEFRANVLTVQVPAVPVVPMLIERTVEELRKQNTRQCLLNRGRSGLECVRDFYFEPVVIQLDEAIGADKAAETHGNNWDWGAGFQLAEDASVNLFGGFEQKRRLDFGTQETLR
jgi:hypothetical protein